MVSVRIRMGKGGTVKALLELLRQAYKGGDVRLIRRALALLALSDGQCDQRGAQARGGGLEPLQLAEAVAS